MTWASAGKALVFHYNTVAKTVISSVSLSSPLISSVSLPFVALLVFPASWHCWFLSDILSGILVLHCSLPLMYIAIKFKPQRGKAQWKPPPLLSVAAAASLSHPLSITVFFPALTSFDSPFLCPYLSFFCTRFLSVSFPFYSLHVNKQSNGVAGSSWLGS